MGRFLQWILLLLFGAVTFYLPCLQKKFSKLDQNPKHVCCFRIVVYLRWKAVCLDPKSFSYIYFQCNSEQFSGKIVWSKQMNFFKYSFEKVIVCDEKVVKILRETFPFHCELFPDHSSFWTVSSHLLALIINYMQLAKRKVGSCDQL